MRAFIFFFMGLFATFTLNAQENEQEADTLWKFEGVSALNFSQVKFKNWAAGGEDSYTINGLVNLGLSYNKKKLSWETSLDLAYGVIKQSNDPIKKSNDKIDLSSKLGYNASKQWLYTALLGFNTQFNEGYQYNDDDTKTLISDGLSPGYLLYSAGMDYKPNKIISIYASVVTGKTTIVKNQDLADAGAFGVDAGNNVRNELGSYLKINYKQEIFKNVIVNSKLDLFSNYLNNPENIDVNWQLFINMKVNEFLSANFNLNVLYDDDVDLVKLGELTSPKVQVKEVFGMGLSYNF